MSALACSSSLQDAHRRSANFNAQMTSMQQSQQTQMSSLDAEHSTTRSIHMPAARAYSPPSHFAARGGMSPPAAMPLAMKITAAPGKGPLHWQTPTAIPHAAAAATTTAVAATPSSVTFASSPPVLSGLTASLLAQKMQLPTVCGSLPGTATVPSDDSPAAAYPQHHSQHLPLPFMQRATSVPSSSGSTVSFASGFDSCGSATSTGAPSPSHRVSPTMTLNSLVEAPPCPVSLWWGVEESDHAKSVLNNYACKLQLYTQQQPGCRAPLEFIGRVKRDRLDVARLHRHAEQHRRQYPSRRQMSGRSASLLSGTSPCFGSSFSPSSSPCSGLGVGPASVLESLPLPGSFATLDCVSVYSRDTLPLGVSFPLIRHEWVCTVWNRDDGIAESIRPIHTEYNDQPEAAPAGEEHRESEDSLSREDEEETMGKRVLRVFARSLAKVPTSASVSRRLSSAKQSPSRSPQVTPAAASAQAVPHSSLASFPSTHQGAAATSASSVAAAASQSNGWHPAAQQSGWHPSMPQTHHHQSHHHPHHSAPTSPSTLPTSYLYCLPIFSSDCKDGCYSTFGTRVQRDTTDTFARRRSLSNGRPQPTSQAGLVATVAEASLGYAGSQNTLIYRCMKTLGRKCGGSSNSASVGNGGDDTKGEASTIVDHDMEMRAMTAALQRMHEEDEAAAAAAASGIAPSTDEDELVEASDDEEASSSEEDDTDDDDDDDNDDDDETLDSIGDDVPRSSAAKDKSRRFDEDDDDEEEEEDDDEDDDASDSESSSGSSSSSASDSDSSEEEEAAPPKSRTTSGSMAIKSNPQQQWKKNATAPRAAARAARRTAADEDDDFDSFSASPSSTSFGRSFGGGGGSSLAVGSLGDELAAQLSALNGGKATTKPKANAKKARK